MTRLFNVYYPTRTLARLLCEVILVSGSFMLATILFAGPDWRIVLIYENGLLKIAGITVFTLLLTYYFDLYGPRRFSESWEIYFRLLLVLSVLSFVLAGLVYLFPELDIGPYVFVVGASFLAVLLVLWRWAYEWIIGLPMFSERVYVLGSGQRAHAVVELLRTSRDAGMKVVGWKGESETMGGWSASPRSFAPSEAQSQVLIASLLPWKTAAKRCPFENCLTSVFAASSLKIPAR